jgi:hypothetical protein
MGSARQTKTVDCILPISLSLIHRLLQCGRTLTASIGFNRRNKVSHKPIINQLPQNVYNT